MSGLLAVLIFGVAYPLTALVVACLGVFGIAASRADLAEAARQRAKAQWGQSSYEVQYRQTYYRAAVAGRSFAVLAAAAFWPLAIPLWFAWKKGDFVNQALVKRADADQLARKRVAS